MEEQANASILHGKKIAFFGRFSFWPRYHGGPPETVAIRHGAKVVQSVEDSLDFLVLGDKRGAGRADAKKKALRLQSQAAKKEAKSGVKLRCVQILDEAEFRELVRQDVSGKRFAFCGGFDCCPNEMESLLEGMVTQVAGVVQADIDETLNYLVVGNRRAKGKTAALRDAENLVGNGSDLAIIDESAFLELVRTEKSSGDDSQEGGEMTFAAFVSNMYGVADERKTQRALKMLQKDSFQLYSNANEDRVVGVVKSQTGSGSVYSPWIMSNGKYGCSTPDLDDCMGLQGAVCKHLLVLLLGLVRAGELPADNVYRWLRTAGAKSPSSGGELAAEAFLQYKGVEAGEVDWRPTETVPEDFYVL